MWSPHRPKARICDLIVTSDCHPWRWWDLRKSHYSISSTEPPSEGGRVLLLYAWRLSAQVRERNQGVETTVWLEKGYPWGDVNEPHFSYLENEEVVLEDFWSCFRHGRSLRLGHMNQSQGRGQQSWHWQEQKLRETSRPEAYASGFNGKPFIHSIHSTIICWVSFLSGERRRWTCSGG